MAFPRGLLVASAVLALCVGACGGSGYGGGATTTAATAVDTNPTASAPDAKAPPPDATEPGTGTITTDQNEVDVRVPATFVVRDGDLSPRTITVPPFLAVELSVRAADGSAHRLVLRTPTTHALDVGPGERAATQIPGLRAGRYVVELDGHPAGALVAGGEVGP